MARKAKSRAATILQRARAHARPPRRETVLEWAERERRLTDGVSSVEGRFRALPYQRLLLEVLTERRYTEHVWMIAAQTMKTESINCAIGYFMDAEPCGIMVVYPTLDRAKDYSKKKLARMIASTACLRNKVKLARARDSGNTLLSKEFPGGDIIISGSNSPSSLRSASRRVVIQDEIDSYEESAGTEGDPCALADTRAENYSNAVKIKASTPTAKGSSRIEQKFEDSTKHRYHVPCPKCGHQQWLKWSCVRWPKDKPEEARYHCEKCDQPWTDAERIRAIHAGEWIAENPDHTRFGAHLSGLYRLIGLKDTYVSYLHEFAAVFLDRKRAGLMAVRAWINTFLAETYEEVSETVDADVIAARAETYLDEDRPPAPGETPPPVTPTPLLPEAGGVLVLVAGVDVQADRLEVEIVGYGRGEETWGIQYAIIPGAPTKRETWDELDAFLLKPWKHPRGYLLTPAAVAVDTGHEPEEVYKYVRRSAGRKIIAVKGSSGGYGEPALSRPRKSGVHAVHLWMVGTVTMKEYIYARLRLVEHGPGFMHFPKNPRRGYDAAYYKGLTAEKVITKWRAGRKELKFVNPSGKRNEPIDIRSYAHGAFLYLNPDFDTLAKKVEAMDAPPPEPEPTVPVVNPQPEQPVQPEEEKPAAVEPPKPEPPPEPVPNTYRVTPPPPVRRVIRGPRRNFATNW